MSGETLHQSILDEEHLKLLALGYMVSGGFAALFSLFGLLYIAIGIVMSVAIAKSPPATGSSSPPPEFIGWIFSGIGFFIFLAMIGVAAAKFWTALCIRRRKSRVFCIIVAAFSCLEFPYGTLLGVLTFMVLGRDSVEQMFAPRGPGPSAAP
jgi:hypothetical protein